MNKTDWQASMIKIAAVITATPRWVAALLAAEGLTVPDAWMSWWLPASALMSAAMAVVEGWAFAYVFAAWRNQRDRSSRWLLALALISAGIFIVVVAPYIAASVRQVPLSEILSTPWSLYLWAAAVAASTISIVASVGYAQKQNAPPRPERVQPMPAQPAISVYPAEQLPAPKSYSCASCEETFSSGQKLAAHMRWNHREVPAESELPY